MADSVVPIGTIPPVVDWPEILVGPILRAVTRSSVSVFLAFKTTQSVVLYLYGPDGEEFRSTAQQTRTLGTHLHVVVVTLQLTAGSELKPNSWYGYDVSFHDSAGEHLVSEQGEDLAYARSQGVLRPGFCAPPPDITSLRLVHASCRLPHGDTGDALPGLDDYLRTKPLALWTYPHHLIFHGDQIYADDVAPAVLHLAQTIGELALGWSALEALPSFLEPPNQNPQRLTSRARELRPTLRHHLLGVDGCFSSDDMGCHLATFAEFVGMYLLVWSPALWPRTLAKDLAIPAIEDVLPVIDWEEDPITLKRNETEAEIKFDHAAASAKYEASIGQVHAFGTQLHRVRRALANVPTFMCFDDHEVTDDWMLNGRWRDSLNASALAQRIVTNALAAYAIFQHWGSCPTEFIAGRPGGEFLDAVELWSAQMSSPSDGPVQGPPPPPQVLGRALGVPRLLGLVDESSIQWHYRVDFATYDLRFLDTRTDRNFPDHFDAAAAGLLSEPALSQLWPSYPTPQVTLVVSPAPILGPWIVEHLIQPTYKTLPLIGSVEAADYEAWEFNSAAFEAAVSALSGHGQVFVLSGDVHYSLCVVGEHERRNGMKTEIVQFTSSPLCNKLSMPRLLAAASVTEDRPLDFYPAFLKAFGSTEPPWWTKVPVVPAGLLSLIARLWTDSTANEVLAATVLRDQRSLRDRCLAAESSAVPHSPPAGVTTAGDVANAADGKLNTGYLEVSHAVVGCNGFAELKFSSDSVTQSVYFDPFAQDQTYVPLPYTKISVPLVARS